jgi:DNA-binding XRE family transcriptional regulator
MEKKRNIMGKINRALKTKISNSNKSKIEIAGDAGIYSSHLLNIANGVIEPENELKEKIAKALNCKVTDIF